MLKQAQTEEMKCYTEDSASYELCIYAFMSCPDEISAALDETEMRCGAASDGLWTTRKTYISSSGRIGPVEKCPRRWQLIQSFVT